MKLWIDDVRNPPDNSWDLVARTYAEACRMIIKHRDNIAVVSFDHDLGETKTGYDIAKFIEYGAFLGVMPRICWQIHSQNPVGADAIRRAMTSAHKHWSDRDDDYICIDD